MDSGLVRLSWDSEFFSRPIGRITAAALNDESARRLLDTARAEELACLYFEADPNDLATVLAVEKHGFHLADVRAVLEYPFEDRPAPSLRYPVPRDLIVTTAVHSDLSRLEEIGTGISEVSRYRFDEHFTDDDARRLYQAWIRNAMSGLSDAVLVARWKDHGDAVGVIACSTRETVSHIDLAGVHHAHRQRGVGTGLVQAALDWAIRRDATRMEVVTQARNVPAQRLYQQMGFFSKSTRLVYHKWLEPSGPGAGRLTP
jgi:ribosomal protein S18 acetylase RimI-like enzyme